jgi:UDP-2,3-diacylglucosamine hydrolase
VTTLPLLCLQTEQVWVWADLHLHQDQASEILRFAEQIQSVPAEIQAVLVLGDLFDAWVGPETWQDPAFQPLVDAFRQLHARQIDLILLRGNRDVLMNPADVAQVHAQLADSVLLKTGSSFALLSHGDEYCLNDLPYQRLRRTLRRPLVRGILRALPHRLRKRIAAKMRGHSERAVGRKPMDMMALNEGAVLAALAKVRGGKTELGDGLAVIGHLHQERQQKLAEGRFLHVLPAWEPGIEAWTLEASVLGGEAATKA